MRGCALRKVVRNLAHKKLENRGVEPQHLPSQIPRPAPTGCSPVSWWMAEKPGAEGNPGSPGEKNCRSHGGRQRRQRFEGGKLTSNERPASVCALCRRRRRARRPGVIDNMQGSDI